MSKFPSRSIDAACENRLEEILSEMFPMLRLWLQAVAKAGLSVPKEWIPRILEEGRPEGFLPFVPPVLDAEGFEWVAAHKAWRPLVVFDPGERKWTQKKLRARLAHLKMLRARDPAEGLRAIEESWEGQDENYRRRAIKVLGEGLSPRDEDFLEKVLDDPDDVVRSEARIFLWRELPASRFFSLRAERVAERWGGVCRSEVREGAREIVFRELDPDEDSWIAEVLDPEEIPEKYPTWSEERFLYEWRRRVFSRIAHMAPLASWIRATGMSPDEIVHALLRRSEPADPAGHLHGIPIFLGDCRSIPQLALEAIRSTTRREGDAEWAGVLIAARCRGRNCGPPTCLGLHVFVPGLARLRPLEERLRLLELAPEEFTEGTPFYQYSLDLFPHSSDPVLERTRVGLFARVLDDFEAWLVNRPGYAAGDPWYGFGEGLAWTTPDDLLDMAMTRVRQCLGRTEMHPGQRPAVERLAECLTFRIEMLREIREASAAG